MSPQILAPANMEQIVPTPNCIADSLLSSVELDTSSEDAHLRETKPKPSRNLVIAKFL